MRSTEEILTTHIGSLPRTDRLIEMLNQRDRGDTVDEDEFADAVDKATRAVLRKQADVGIDIANDGEQRRPGFNIYAENRMSGFGDEGKAPRWADLQEFPNYARKAFEDVEADVRTLPLAVGPVSYDDPSVVREELATLSRLVDEEDVDFEGTFMTSISPGQVVATFQNDHYDSREEYVFAVADAIQTEYEVIADSEATLQIDAPDLLGERHRTYQDLSTDEFREIVRTNVEAINRATENIPPEKVRLHACWGNYEGSHHLDVELAEVLPVLYEADVGALALELANPRHNHEYEAFEEHPFPDDMALIPGVIDVKTNIVEHPDLVAERIERAADAVGDPTRVVAAADCGFGTLIGWRTVDRDIAWKKLESLTEGAAIASDRLF